MKKKKKEFILIKGTIFPFDILYTTACTNSLIKYIEKNKNYLLNDEEKEKLEMNGNGRTIQLRGGQVIIRLKKEKTKIGIDLPTLSHEISHAIFFILDRVGIKHDNSSDELYGYYHGYLMQYILNKI